MKKIMCVAVLAALLVSNVSAASKSSKSAAPKEKNKIGGYVGTELSFCLRPSVNAEAP